LAPERWKSTFVNNDDMVCRYASRVASILVSSVAVYGVLTALLSSQLHAAEVKWSFCEQIPPPSWLAVQNGDGPWTRVNPKNDTYTFEISSKGSVATVREATEFGINAGLNDAWFNHETPGQGFFITVFPNRKQMFVAMFTYDIERPDDSVTAFLGEPGHRWFTAFGDYDGTGAVLNIEITSGGIFDSPEPEPSQKIDGTLTIEFTDCASGFITYDIPSLGLMRTIPIRRLADDNEPLCEALNPVSSLSLYIYNGTVDNLQTKGQSYCVGSGRLNTVRGSVAGIDPTDRVEISMGGIEAIVSGQSAGDFMADVNDVEQDLVAVRSKVEIIDFEEQVTALQAIIRRNVHPADGAVLPLLDFGSDEAFDFTDGELTIENLNGDEAGGGVIYGVKNTQTVWFLDPPLLSTDSTRPFRVVPPSKQVANDRHILQLQAFDSASPVFQQIRAGWVGFRDGTQAQTLELGPALGPVTVTVVGEPDYPLIRWQHERQAEYFELFSPAMVKFGGGGFSTIQVIITGGFLGDSDIDYTLPDLRGVAGWKSGWGVGDLSAGNFPAWGLEAFDIEGCLDCPSYNWFWPEGERVRSASRTGLISE
jgi:hypothetical protein